MVRAAHTPHTCACSRVHRSWTCVHVRARCVQSYTHVQACVHVCVPLLMGWCSGPPPCTSESLPVFLLVLGIFCC